MAIENAELYRRIEDEAVLRNNLLRFFPPATIQKISASSGEKQKLTDGAIHHEAVGPLQLKGKEESLPLRRVLWGR
jgi:hypothetical protein